MHFFILMRCIYPLVASEWPNCCIRLPSVRIMIEHPWWKWLEEDEVDQGALVSMRWWLSSHLPPTTLAWRTARIGVTRRGHIYISFVHVCSHTPHDPMTLKYKHNTLFIECCVFVMGWPQFLPQPEDPGAQGRSSDTEARLCPVYIIFRASGGVVEPDRPPSGWYILRVCQEWPYREAHNLTNHLLTIHGPTARS
jgi:hypothetical protein